MKKDNLHSNKSGFKLPEGYFESFEENLLNKLASDDSSQDILDKDVSSGHVMPNGYLDSFEENLIKKLQQSEYTPKKGKIVSLFSRRNVLYISGIAAMIAIIISIAIDKNNPALTIDSLDIADIQAYIEDGNLDFSNDDIAALLDDDANYEDTFENKTISEEELLEYLSNEDLDDEMIFTE